MNATETHAPGRPEKIRHPGGKNGWYRVECVAPGCAYSATEAYPGRAESRVRDHAAAKNAAEESR